MKGFSYRLRGQKDLKVLFRHVWVVIDTVSFEPDSHDIDILVIPEVIDVAALYWDHIELHFLSFLLVKVNSCFVLLSRNGLVIQEVIGFLPLLCPISF